MLERATEYSLMKKMIAWLWYAVSGTGLQEVSRTVAIKPERCENGAYGACNVV